MAQQTHEAIARLRAGETAIGRVMLMEAMAAGEPAGPIWYALALAADSPDERRVYLEKTLAADPLNDDARRDLAALAHRQSVALPLAAPSPAAARAGVAVMKPLPEDRAEGPARPTSPTPHAVPALARDTAGSAIMKSLPDEHENASPRRAPPAAPPTQKKGLPLALTLILLIIGACGFFSLTSGGASGGGAAAHQAPDKFGAWDVCKQQVRKQLKSPSTATFPSATASDLVVTQNGKTFGIVGYVDAENSFGARIRSTIVCEATHTSGTNWSVRASVTSP